MKPSVTRWLGRFVPNTLAGTIVGTNTAVAVLLRTLRRETHVALLFIEFLLGRQKINFRTLYFLEFSKPSGAGPANPLRHYGWLRRRFNPHKMVAKNRWASAGPFNLQSQRLAAAP